MADNTESNEEVIVDTEENEIDTTEELDESSEEVDEEDSEEVDDTDAEEESTSEETAKPHAASNTIRKLRKELQAERAKASKADKLEAEMAEIRNRLSQPRVDPEQARRIREEKLALLEPQERESFLLKEQIQELKQSQAATQLHVIDATDKAAYDAKATLNPIYAKHKDAVESALAEMRNRGQNVSREELLKWVIGNAALNAKPTKASQIRKQAAQQRVQSVKTKPVNSASSSPSEYTGNGKSVEERLRGVLI